MPVHHPTFRTKSCFCRITPEQILFLPPMGYGEQTFPFEGQWMRRQVIASAMMGVIGIVVGVTSLSRRGDAISLFFIGFGLFACTLALFTRRMISNGTIERSEIIGITAYTSRLRGIPGTIVVESKRGGTIRRRRLKFPQRGADPEESMTAAVTMMRAAGLDVREE
jgi:hypothetical protein